MRPPPLVVALRVAVALTMLTACSTGAPAPSPSTRAVVSAGSPAPLDPLLARALVGYRRYVDGQLAALTTSTVRFADAVRAGRDEQARLLYPQARVHYERIEPAAEIWGSLDLAVDGRANDVVAATRFRGFHRLEQVLWTSGDQAGQAGAVDGVATRLVADVRRLQRLAAATRYTTLELTNGATELLNEIESRKITGEEERYSHLDLVDVDANVAGCLRIVTLLSPYLGRHSPGLLGTIRTRAAVVLAALRHLRAAPGADGTGYPSYADVAVGQRRTLSNDVEALAQPVALLTAVTSH